MRIFQLLFFLMFIFLSSSCSDLNAFKQFSNQTNDEALYQEALKKIDALAYSEAISIITTQMNSGYAQKTKVREALMGAYAGKCGMSFITLIDGMSGASGGVFSLAFSTFSGIAVDTASCDSAVSVLQSLGTSSQRTQNQNFYAAILGLGKLGVTLHKRFDIENSGLGDGVVDAGWDVCAEPSSGTDGQLTDAEVKKAVVGLGLIFENLTVLIAAIGGSNAGVGAMDAAKTSCEAVAGAGNCTITDESSAAITPQVIRFFRRMISSSSLGLGTCDLSPGPSYCCSGLATP